MAIVKNADGSITVGMIPEAEKIKAEVEEPTSAPKKKTTTKKK